jgi:hypothetical protein
MARLFIKTVRPAPKEVCRFEAREIEEELDEGLLASAAGDLIRFISPVLGCVMHTQECPRLKQYIYGCPTQQQDCETLSALSRFDDPNEI